MDLLKSLKLAANNPFLAPTKKMTAKNERHRVIFWSGKGEKELVRLLSGEVESWRLKDLASTIVQIPTENDTIWILQPKHYAVSSETSGHHGLLLNSRQGVARDLCGSWLRLNKISGSVDFEFHSAHDDEIRGAIIGLGLAQYKFLDVVKGKVNPISWRFTESSGGKGKTSSKSIAVNPSLIFEAASISSAMNIARHLTNLPAASTQPKELSAALAQFFKGQPGLKIQVLNTAQLKKEKMGLLVGVGQGSQDGAYLVHLNYRPSGKNSTINGDQSTKGKKKSLKEDIKKRPYAFVGKGVIFDTGGLDLKPSAGMRLMKKDMAGSAAVAGLCYLVSELKLKTACDFYLPFAENAVSSSSTRPGDVHMSRSGHMVEIDNTDAEGRLVMADAIDYAVTQKGSDAPQALFDVSTLTGAMRVALGLDVAGFFTNTDALSKDVEKSSAHVGEYAWRMPLLKKYESKLSSSFADFKNSADGGFGGAITAALFLEKFVRDTPWVHFDVMSWNTSSDGAVCEGGNAQCVQILADMLIKKG